MSTSDQSNSELRHYVAQQSFPNLTFNARPARHLLGLQSVSPAVPCNIACGDHVLKTSDDFVIKFIIDPSPVCSYLAVELQLFVPGKAPSKEDSARALRQRIKVAFPTYDESSAGKYGARRRYNYTSKDNNRPPSGPADFCRQLLALEHFAGNDKRIEKSLLHDSNKYKPEDQLVFRWRAESSTTLQWNTTGVTGSTQSAAIETFKKIMTELIAGGKRLIVVTRAFPAIRGVYFPWFSAIPAPTPRPYFPWLDDIDPKDASGVVKLNPRGVPVLWDQFVNLALAIRPENKWIELAAKGEINTARPLETPKIGKLPAVTRFLNERQYIAHVLVSYMYEEAGSRASAQTYLNGAHLCYVVPKVDASNKRRFLLLTNIRPPAMTTAAESAEDFGLPEIGERVTAQLTFNNMAQTWTGSVQQCPENFMEKGANVAMVLEPEATLPDTGYITSAGFLQTELHFGHDGTSTQPTHKRITSLMLENVAGDKFWKDLLLARQVPNEAANKYDAASALPTNFRAMVDSVCQKRGLNDIQKQVVRHYFTHRITIVRGPPGTGKSTLIDCIAEIEFSFATKLWVSADSNAAVDVLANKTCSRLKNVQPPGHLRVKPAFQENLPLEVKGGEHVLNTLATPGSDGELDDAATRAAIAELFQDSVTASRAMSLVSLIRQRMHLPASQRKLWQTENDDINKLKSAANAFTKLSLQPVSEKTWVEDKQRLEKEYLRELRNVQRRLVARMHCIYSTISSASSSLLQFLKPDSLVMDEASQTPEAKAVSALVHALRGKQLKRVLLIGDDKQLPPTVTAAVNPFSASGEVSLFERLIHADFPCITLREQFRMHPDISYVVNQTIYSKIANFSGLANHSVTTQGPGVQKFLTFASQLARVTSTTDFKPSQSVIVSPAVGKDESLFKSKKLRGSTSRYNLTTARIVAHLLVGLVRNGYAAKDIMVISFYADQVRLIKAFTKKQPVLKHLRVMTVDSSQGSESEVVIVDSVLLGNANGDGMGFLGHDIRRFNVAMSRAQKGRIVIAHRNMLVKNSASESWGQLLANAEHNKSFLKGAIFSNSSLPEPTAQASLQRVFDAWQKNEQPPDNEHLGHKNVKNATTTVARQPRLKDLTTRFVELTGCDQQTAQAYLDKNSQNYPKAINHYYNDFPLDGEAEEMSQSIVVVGR